MVREFEKCGVLLKGEGSKISVFKKVTEIETAKNTYDLLFVV